MPDRSRDQIVARYSELARLTIAGGTPADCGAAYGDEDAVPEGALRASLGCGNPLAVADIAPGETVLDLGSGGGLDVILSARRAGPTGRAYGLDASRDMLALAEDNARAAGVTNVEFRHGHLEDIPLPDGHIDVVISNCVINLSTNKPAALAEAFRVLRPGGRLGITDVICDDGLTAARRAAAEKAMGCAAGTITAAEYRGRLLDAGFVDLAISATHQVADGLHSAIVRAGKPAR